ncbi:hypothetical protein FACS1894166_13150 [Bacilli bacterium]|nr:hypothetical protein FACS1894166_13150 [Bacilli bacterium]
MSGSFATASGSTSGMLTVSKDGYTSPEPFLIEIEINPGGIRIDGSHTQSLTVGRALPAPFE